MAAMSKYTNKGYWTCNRTTCDRPLGVRYPVSGYFLCDDHAALRSLEVNGLAWYMRAHPAGLVAVAGRIQNI